MCFHATLLVFLVTVSALSCVETKEVGRGKGALRTSLRQFCTGSGDLLDVLQKGVFRSSQEGTFVERMLQVSSRGTFCRSQYRHYILRREAAVAF